MSSDLIFCFGWHFCKYKIAILLYYIYFFFILLHFHPPHTVSLSQTIVSKVVVELMVSRGVAIGFSCLGQLLCLGLPHTHTDMILISKRVKQVQILKQWI